MNIESPWKTYPKGILFVLPALGAWMFSCTFLLPRLREIWLSVDFGNPTAHTIANLFVWPLAHAIIVVLGTIVALALLEWRGRQWPRFRRLAVGTVVFIFNVAVIFFLTAMLTYGLLAISVK